MALKGSWVWALAIVGIAAYFAVASNFDRTNGDPRPLGKVALLLNSPFFHEGGFAYRASNLPLGVATLLAKIPADDPTNADDTASPIQLYEVRTPLGPGHSTFQAISKTGGHFAHWSGLGIVFSSSDNTDPNKNGRRYWAVVP